VDRIFHAIHFEFASLRHRLLQLPYLAASSSFSLRRTFSFSTGRDDTGPWIRVIRDQKECAAVLLAAGDSANPTARILTLSFEEIPTVFHNQPSGSCLIGGFDSPKTAYDPDRNS
jgi:hypothetical protein